MWHALSSDAYSLTNTIIKHSLLFHILRCPHYAGREAHWNLMPLNILDDRRELMEHEAVCNDRPNLDFLLNMQSVPVVRMKSYQEVRDSFLKEYGVTEEEVTGKILNEEEVSKGVSDRWKANVIIGEWEDTNSSSSSQEFDDGIKHHMYDDFYQRKEPVNLLRFLNGVSESKSNFNISLPKIFPSASGHYNVLIVNLEWSTTENRIREFMTTAVSEKDVISVRLVKRRNGLSKGYAFAKLSSIEAVYKVLRLDGKILDGRQIFLKPGRNKRNRYRGKKRRKGLLLSSEGQPRQ